MLGGIHSNKEDQRAPLVCHTTKLTPDSILHPILPNCNKARGMQLLQVEEKTLLNGQYWPCVLHCSHSWMMMTFDVDLRLVSVFVAPEHVNKECPLRSGSPTVDTHLSFLLTKAQLKLTKENLVLQTVPHSNNFWDGPSSLRSLIAVMQIIMNNTSFLLWCSEGSSYVFVFDLWPSASTSRMGVFIEQFWTISLVFLIDPVTQPDGQMLMKPTC